jgi:hypothetical protein
MPNSLPDILSIGLYSSTFFFFKLIISVRMKNIIQPKFIGWTLDGPHDLVS